VTVYLELRHVLATHEAATGGDGRAGDLGLIQSACARPQATAFGEDAYPTIWEKAAAFLHSLTKNHGFPDGNKRTAWACTVAFLGINGHPLDPAFDEDEAIDFVLAIADGTISDVPSIASGLVKFCS
jgi:death-on-curing protein